MPCRLDDDRRPNHPSSTSWGCRRGAPIRCRAELVGIESTPITSPSPWDSAVISAAMPTPPSPTTMTACPGPGRPALRTAPPPVRTAHPRTAATSGGTSSATGTTECRSTTAWWRKRRHPEVVLDVLPSRCRRGAPPRRGPALLAALPGCRARAVGWAFAALAAARQERHDDALANRDSRRGRRASSIRAGRLVAQQHRDRPRPVAVDDRQVGMADARRLDPDQELAGSRRVELSSPMVIGRDRAQRRGSSQLLQDCSGDPHQVPPIRRPGARSRDQTCVPGGRTPPSHAGWQGVRKW